jgi:hypothetical protein
MYSAKEAGINAALEKFALFGYGLSDIAHGARIGLVGQAPEVFAQGARAVAPGGALHYGNVLWPTFAGSPKMQWLGRAGTIMQGLALPGMMARERAQGEGRISSLLGSVGSLAGSLYGATAGGIVGMPVGAALGHRLGLGVGHLLGSPAAPPAGAQQ